MGEQACLDALVANTLTSFEDDSITKVGGSGLSNHTALTNVTLSQCKAIDKAGLSGCTNLEVVDILGTGTIGDEAFRNDTKLMHLLMRGTLKTTLSNVNAFTSTPIPLGNGAIYVPSDLLADYMADTNWKNYFITTLDKYPLSDFSTITESWSELDAMTQEQIAAKYSVGDTKLIDLGTEGKVYAQIAGIGVDDLASGGKAKVTFITKGLLATDHRMNPANSSGAQGTGANGGWEHSEMRTYLNDTILPLFPSDLQPAIKSVTKYSDYIVPGESAITHDQETQDKLWIPSAREVSGGSSYEQTGPVYSGLFPDNSSRIKYNQSGSTRLWWLRSALSQAGFRVVYSGGYISSDGDAYYARSVAVGFSL